MSGSDQSTWEFRGATVPKAFWRTLLVTGALLWIVATTAETFSVTAPLGAGLLTSLAFYAVLWRRRFGFLPWFELGSVYVAAVSLYLAYPLVGFLALRQTYTPLNDARLALLQPTAAEVGTIGWLYFCHLAGFGLTYLLVRGRLQLQSAPFRVPRPGVIIAAAAVYAFVEAFAVVIGLFFNMSAGSYAETYLLAGRVPLILAQLLNHLGGSKFTLAFILLAALFSRYRKYRPMIAAWLILVAVIAIARLASRTELVLLLLAAAMMYHYRVRPLPPGAVAVAAVIGLTGFLLLGVLRSARAGSLDLVSANPFRYASEFESLFANAVHLNRVKDSIGELPLTFYLADAGALIPQQLAPYTKIDRAAWYVNRFFPEYAAMGGGLAFGAIPEAILAGGWGAAIFFGAALGYVFARIHRFYVRHADRFRVFVFYVWVTTLSYHSFRNSTFALLVLFAYRFVPAVLLVDLLGQAIRRVLRDAEVASPVAVRAWRST